MENETTSRKISVTFERKVTDGDYGGTTARAWLEDEIASDASSNDIVQSMSNLFAACKVAVLDELGIPFIMDDNGVVREKSVPVVTRNDAPKGVATDAASRIDHAFGSTNHQVRIMNPDDYSGGDMPDWLIEKCAKDGVTAIWYNGHKATGNQPHWREALSKDKRDAGVEAKAYWPPR